MRSSTASRAVSISTGTASPFDRSSRHTSRPLLSGNIRSRITTRNRPSRPAEPPSRRRRRHRRRARARADPSRSCGRRAFVFDQQDSHLLPMRLRRTRRSSGLGSIGGRMDERRMNCHACRSGYARCTRVARQLASEVSNERHGLQRADAPRRRRRHRPCSVRSARFFQVAAARPRRAT